MKGTAKVIDAVVELDVQEAYEKRNDNDDEKDGR